MNVPDDLKYTNEHEWVRVDGDEVVVGITDYAQSELGDVVFVEQYRQGSETVELEIPGGMMDPGETDPVTTALRELREETGYTGENARVIGECFANPAIMDNRVHTILVENCQRTHEVEWDAGEDLITRLIPAADIPHLIRKGQIRHSIIVAALHYFALND